MVELCKKYLPAKRLDKEGIGDISVLGFSSVVGRCQSLIYSTRSHSAYRVNYYLTFFLEEIIFFLKFKFNF